MSNYKTIEIGKFSRMFAALSNPKRLQIFLKLIDSCGAQPCCKATMDEASEFVGELGKDLGIVASTVSHHIKELNRAGLIQIERQGKNVSCWVNPEAFVSLQKFFDR